MTEPRRFLYVVDEEGNEIPGSRREIVDHDWRAVHRAEGELRVLCGEGCEVVDRWE